VEKTSNDHLLQHIAEAEKDGYTQNFTFELDGKLSLFDERLQIIPIYGIVKVEMCSKCKSKIIYITTKEGRGKVLQ